MQRIIDAIEHVYVGYRVVEIVFLFNPDEQPEEYDDDLENKIADAITNAKLTAIFGGDD